MTSKRLLLTYGLLALLGFLASGYLMQQGFPAWYESNEVIRFQYRANHIYLLFSSLLILLYSTSLGPSSSGLQKFIGILLVLANITLYIAFLNEPTHAAAEKPLTFYGVVINLGAVILTLFSQFALQKKNG